MTDKALPNLDEHATRIILRKVTLKKVMPAVIRNLLEQGLLDKSRLNDRDYIQEMFQGNSKIVDDMGVVLLMHDHFLASARDAITANRSEVAVVLIATAIEQIINTFYRQVLKEKDKLSDDEITELIRTSNNNAKFGWLLALVAEYEIHDDLRKDITSVIELRNQIVHYKAISSPLMEETPIEKRIQDFGLDKMIRIPDDLSELLDKALEGVREQMPDYKLAMEAIKLFIE